MPGWAADVSPVVAQARTWRDVRWQHQGRGRSGVDCAGLVIVVARELGLSEFDTADYSRHARDETMLGLCREHMRPVSVATMQPGDVLVMAFENQRHMAIVGDYPAPGELSIIHAYAPSRKVVEMRLDTIWRRRIVACFRFPEVT